MGLMWVLIGEGANCLQIPALVWANHDKALAECKAILGDEFVTKVDDEGYTSYRWQTKSKRGDFPKEVTSKIYTNYYDGCGGFYRVILVCVAEGQPFVGWDLD